jgi:hypothetical protein
MEQEKELNEQLESLYDLWEETQARIRTRLDALKSQYECDSQKWQERFRLMEKATAFLPHVSPPDP